MRVVEPRHFEHNRQTKTRRKTPLLIVFVLVLLLSSAFLLTQDKNESDISVVDNKVANDNSKQLVNGDTDEITKKTGLRTFSDNEFKLFYDNLLQPNLERVENPPTITGNDQADTIIRDLAEKRGYRLRSSPNINLVTFEGFKMQKEVVEPWKNLKSEASKSGLQISIVSAYRSVEDQRVLFLSRLQASGASIESVAAGRGDSQVNKVLVTSSIPGYSKHHTGYTLDLQCAGYAFENFKSSPCHDWLSADNYKRSKEFGFIPSYPPLADAQGPDPEAWEYVWVGTDLLYY